MAVDVLESEWHEPRRPAEGFEPLDQSMLGGMHPLWMMEPTTGSLQDPYQFGQNGRVRPVAVSLMVWMHNLHALRQPLIIGLMPDSDSFARVRRPNG